MSGGKTDVLICCFIVALRLLHTTTSLPDTFSLGCYFLFEIIIYLPKSENVGVNAVMACTS